MYEVTHHTGRRLTLTFTHRDEWGGFWFTDGENTWFAHNPEHPETEDPYVALSYDYTHE